MTDIPTDVKYSYVDVTQNISINEDVFVDSLKNVHCNEIRCTKLFTDEVHVLTEVESMPRTSRSFNPAANEAEFTTNHCTGTESLTLGGEFNEVQGNYSSILGGKENEVSGNYSTVIGGMNHQCIGDFSVCMGVNSVAQHDYSFVLNTDVRNQAVTTDSNQCILNATQGVFFRIPECDAVRTDHVSEGMACFVWDKSSKRICVKTKQNNVLYKACLPTIQNEIEVEMNVDSFDRVFTTIKNPDVTRP